MKSKPKFDGVLAMLKRSSPTILTVAAAIGVVATAVTASKATIKAQELIEDAEIEYDVELNARGKIKTVWKSYIPTVLIGAGTIACIVGANVLNKRHQAELVSAYALIKESYEQYRGAAKAVYGEDADRKIKAEMAKQVYVGDYTSGAFVYSS